MRSLFAIPLLAACASNPPAAGTASYDSVRARLAAEPTRLLMSASDSAGSITASHYTSDGWQTGMVALTISDGELDAHADADGKLAMTALEIDLGTIDIPPTVFGKPAQMRDVKLAMSGAPDVTTTWSDADDATATATVALDLSWTLAINNGTTPLGTQSLAPMPVDVTLTGTGDQVDATIAIHKTGDLWSWADLVKLGDLTLTLAAASN